MTLKVIGAGFGRTGTSSLKIALEQLGYDKCHHMTEVISSRKQIDFWYCITQGEQPLWDDVFSGFHSSVDFPSSIYYQELAAHYPDAKIILTLRSPESWYKSASDTIFKVGSIAKWLRIFPRVRRLHVVTNQGIWGKLFDHRFTDKDYAIKVYNRHIEAVKAAIPAHRLLIMEIKEGWRPICNFLGQDIPDTAFPHANDTAEFKKLIFGLRIVEIIPWLALLVSASYIALQVVN